MKFPDSAAASSNGGIGTPSSLQSSDTLDDLSLSPSSCITPSDPDADLSYTVGVTENTPYGCQFCDKAFPRLSYLKRHEQVHSDQMPFRCDYCQRLFKHKRSRDRHVKLHTGDRKYRCTHCESAFSRSDHLKIHLKTHDNAKPYQCTVCNRGYNTAAALSSHMQNHNKKEGTPAESPNSNLAFRCGQCALTFSSATELQSHVNGQCQSSTSPEPKPVPCSFCPQLCSSPATLKDHVTQNHQSLDQKGQCLKCQEEQTPPDAICRHNKAVEENAQNSFAFESISPTLKLTCGFCSKSDFPTLESLQLHVQVLHVPVSEPASSLLSNASLLQHKSRHHKPHLQSGSYFECELCHQTFSSVQNLQKHTLSTHSFTEVLAQKLASDVYCSQCNLGFPSGNSLLEHVSTVHEPSHNATQEVSRTPPLTNPSPCSSSKRSLLSCRLRPNGTKHAKTSSMLGSSSPLFNGNTSHYRRQNAGDATGGETDGSGIRSNGVSPLASSSASSNTLLCSQCNAAFPDFESFRTHLKSHLDSAGVVIQRFACTECDGEFESQHQLEVHLVRHFMSSTTEYGCQSCLKMFAKPDELQKHLLDIHAHHLYRCTLCKEIFDSKVSIQVHFAVKHSNECRIYRCTSCSAIFRTELEFQVHVKLTHLSSKSLQAFRCLLCDQFFPSEAQLEFHTATHKKQFRCSLCDEEFHVEFLLDRHMQTNHFDKVGSQEHSLHPFHSRNQISHHDSEVAQNLSVKRSSLSSSHPQRNDQETAPVTTIASSNETSASPPAASSNAGSREFRCDVCDCYYSTETSLNIHRRQAHNIRTNQKSAGQSATLSLFCAYCNEACKSRSELENHMKTHTASPSKHKCNICDEMCPTASTLAEHKLTHCKVVAGSTCTVCRVTLSTEEQFFGHVQQHNNHGFPVPCVVCRQTLITDVEVQMHAKFHLKSCEPRRPCCVCSQRYETSSMIITSKRDSGAHTYMCKDCFHSKSDDPRCSECGVKFETPAELDCHRKSTHKKTYQCIKCQMSFDSEAEIQAHVTCHVLQEGTSHECNLCHKVLDSPSKLQCHLIEHTFEGCTTFTCYMCSAVFTGPHLLQQHMLEHGLDTKPYDCSKCNQRFFFRAELDNHSFVHQDEAMVHHSAMAALSQSEHQRSRNLCKCPLCPLVFLDITEMQQHHFQCHSDSDLQESKTFPCGECGKEFPCMSNLQGHMRLHSRGAKHTCPECHKEFALSRNLHVHLRSHSGEKPYECPVCKKRFARKENRKAHQKSHAGVRPFLCPHCGKTFSRRSHVKEHMRIHITSTTHLCETCNESFSSNRLLRRHHKDAHQKHYDHVCSVCGDVFEQVKGLNNHLQKHHQVRTSENLECSMDDSSESSAGEAQSTHSAEGKDATVDTDDCGSDELCEEDGAESNTSAAIAADEDRPVLTAEVVA